MSRGLVVALVGAESTGKTTLARALADVAVERGQAATMVGEVLREFCDARGRTPRREEQADIAREQSRRIEAAALASPLVFADTTALMIAVYSDLVFGDESLYAESEAAQRRCDRTLLTSLDLPWQADGLQRDGPHVRDPVDARLRAALGRAGVRFQVVDGSGPSRLRSALALLDDAMPPDGRGSLRPRSPA